MSAPRLPDRAALAAVLDSVPWLEAPRVDAAPVRLRVKPGVNIRAGVVVPTAGGPRAVLLAAFAAPGKTARLAARPGATRVGPWAVLPAEADPALADAVPAGASPLGYNPARRWIGRAAGAGGPAVAVKVLADPPAPPIAELYRRWLPGTTIAGRVVHSPWIVGDPVSALGSGPGVAGAVRAAVDAVHAGAAPPGLPVLDAETVLAAAARAVRSVAETDPAVGALLERVLGRLADRPWPRARVLVHGDLSPDQVVLDAAGTTHLLDPDRAAVGPPGWDAATWAAALAVAERAPGTSGGEPFDEPEPVLRTAALILRAPEPRRRLHPEAGAVTAELAGEATAALGCGARR